MFKFNIVSSEVDEKQALIYLWEIHDPSGVLVGRYIGKAKNGSRRPLKDYARNVHNILNKKPYRKSNPNGFRRIHYALADVQLKNFKVTLHFLCNVKNEECINSKEQKLIHFYNCCGSQLWQLNG